MAKRKNSSSMRALRKVVSLAVNKPAGNLSEVPVLWCAEQSRDTQDHALEIAANRRNSETQSCLLLWQKLGFAF
jgi:hypothetical protein